MNEKEFLEKLFSRELTKEDILFIKAKKDTYSLLKNMFLNNYERVFPVSNNLAQDTLTANVLMDLISYMQDKIQQYNKVLKNYSGILKDMEERITQNKASIQEYDFKGNHEQRKMLERCLSANDKKQDKPTSSTEEQQVHSLLNKIFGINPES